MDSSEINRMLSDRMQELCSFLLPNGHTKGNLYVVGGLDGSAGESLQITISGAAAGRFKDFAGSTDDKGATPLWLVSKVKGIPFKEAVTFAKDWLGVKDDDFGIHKHKSKSFAKPEKGGVKIAEPNTKVMDYLVCERRIDPIVIANAKICETDDGEAIAFPYIEKDENGKDVCVHRKYLGVDRPDGKKKIWTPQGTKRCLFGKNLIGDDVRELNITEGEIDALSLNSVSLPAVSVPNGVLDFEWVNLDWEWLQRFERINYWRDMDDPGEQSAPEVCKRLGLHRTYIIENPHKDANDCLVAGFKQDDFLKLIAAGKAIELDEIKRPDEFASEVHDYYNTDWNQRGWETPWWPNLPWRIRKAEFTVLSGFSGHGKTIALNQLMLHLVSQGCKIMDASLEVKPGMTLYNMTRCALGKKQSSKDEITGCISWLNESMLFLDCIGTVSVNRLMQAMEYARKRHGIDVFVIDSLFKCGLSSEDYGGQREFADKLTTFCNNTGAHVILVAHSRKTSNGNEYAVPTKSDVAGSSDLVNAAFNVIIWWRNKLKKRKLDEAKQSFPVNLEEISKWIDAPDGKAIIDKQRFGEGEEAEVFMWFDQETTQFHICQNKKFPYFVLKS